MLATTEGRSDMDILIKGRNIPVTEALERYAWEKVERVARFFDEERTASRAEVELIHERNRAVSEPEVAEATLFINGSVLKASEASEDMYASIDGMSDKLERQVKRFRGRQIDRWQGQLKNTPDVALDGAQPFVVEEEEEIEASHREDQAVPDEADGRRGGRPPAGAPRPRLLRVHERRYR